MEGRQRYAMTLAIIWALFFCTAIALSDRGGSSADLDERVASFLREHKRSWSDWNVPYEDGKILYNLVLKGGFKNILEIGTSTGHSTIWLAWAASKTGGKVTTIEIDRGRYEEALKNLQKTGLSSYVDARLADAHELVPALEDAYDFVFCDADKDWYVQYFKDVRKKIPPHGCFSAHNVSWRSSPDIERFLDYVKEDKDFRTAIERGSGEGISVSCRVGG